MSATWQMHMTWNIGQNENDVCVIELRLGKNGTELSAVRSDLDVHEQINYAMKFQLTWLLKGKGSQSA